LFKKSFQILKERIGKKNTNLKSQQKKTYQRTINKKKEKITGSFSRPTKNSTESKLEKMFN
jgi:hypothetical protein